MTENGTAGGNSARLRFRNWQQFQLLLFRFFFGSLLLLFLLIAFFTTFGLLCSLFQLFSDYVVLGCDFVLLCFPIGPNVLFNFPFHSLKTFCLFLPQLPIGGCKISRLHLLEDCLFWFIRGRSSTADLAQFSAWLVLEGTESTVPREHLFFVFFRLFLLFLHHFLNDVLFNKLQHVPTIHQDHDFPFFIVNIKCRCKDSTFVLTNNGDDFVAYL